jgi:hypothetical protein
MWENSSSELQIQDINKNKHNISLIETMFGCLPYDNRELIVHVFDCCNDKPFCVLFWNDPDDFKHWLIEIVQQETYAQMNRTG